MNISELKITAGDNTFTHQKTKSHISQRITVSTFLTLHHWPVSNSSLPLLDVKPHFLMR
jgi:hypothetical protein